MVFFQLKHHYKKSNQKIVKFELNVLTKLFFFSILIKHSFTNSSFTYLFDFQNIDFFKINKQEQNRCREYKEIKG